MKLSILPEKITVKRKPEYWVSLYYENETVGKYIFSELTDDLERFIGILQDISKRYKIENGKFCCYFSDELNRMFDEDHETYDFLMYLNSHNYCYDLVNEDNEFEYAFMEFKVEYIDENGDWHNIKIESDEK